MTIVEELQQNKNLNGVKLWEGMTAQCKETQERILFEIINLAKDTEFGKSHGFGDIKTVKDYQKAVPVTQWADIEALSERMMLGEEDILFPGRAAQFICTSGTTGKPKALPESKMSILAKNNVVIIRALYLLSVAAKNPRFAKWLQYKKIDPSKLDMKALIGNCCFYPIIGAPQSMKTPAGIDMVFASGSTLDNSGLSQAAAYPPQIVAFSNAESVNYLTMLFSIRRKDLLVVVGNNATSFKVRLDCAKENAQMLIDDMRKGTVSESVDLTPEERALVNSLLTPDPERADELQAILDSGAENFIPTNYWPYMLLCCFWLSGSVGMNIRELVPLINEDVVFMDGGYGASEAKINVPYLAGEKDGTLATFAAFFEFMDMETEKVFQAHELEVGKEYELLLTTFAGLYRYDIHDIVRVNGFHGNTPNIEFISKAGEILNVAQEKMPASIAVGSLKDFLKEKGVNLKHAQVYMNLEDKRYDVYFEVENDLKGGLDMLTEEFDKYLMTCFDMYDYVRRFNFMNQLALIEMKKGWQENLFQEKVASGANMSQIKLKLMIKERPDKEWIK